MKDTPTFPPSFSKEQRELLETALRTNVSLAKFYSGEARKNYAEYLREVEANPIGYRRDRCFQSYLADRSTRRALMSAAREIRRRFADAAWELHRAKREAAHKREIARIMRGVGRRAA